jgi:hypothetical protein
VCSGERRVSDNSYFLAAVIIYGAILLAFLALLILKSYAWAKYDAGRFYEMADVILKGGIPYIDFKDPKPPLIFFTLVPLSYIHVQLEGGYLLVALCNLASALLIFKTGWRLYGRLPGLLAGLFFVVNLPWIEGIFIFTEPFSLLFLLASAYALLFWGVSSKYIIAGACAGIAIGFKQYALLAIPLSLLLLYLKGELKGFIAFMAGLLLVMVVIFGAFYLVYGPSACQSALYWSFGLAGDYISQDYIGGEVSAWKPNGPVQIAANLIYVVIPLLSLLVYSLACFLRGGRGEAEYFFFASGLAYLGTLLIRPYFHYLVLALPFAALLCASAFRDRAEAHQPGAYAPTGNNVRFK